MLGRGTARARSDRRQARALATPPFPNVITPVKTAAYTTRYWELVRCDPTAGGFTVTLPTAVGCAGQKIGVKNASASTNTITIDGKGTETVDGAANVTITTARGYRELVSDGTNWLTT